MRKCKPHESETEYKAYAIELLAKPEKSNSNSSSTKSKLQVVICQGSSCSKQGSKAVYEKLQSELHSQGIVEQVEIKITGCLKQCKQGPNLIMPDKNRHSRVKLQQVFTLVQKYLVRH